MLASMIDNMPYVLAEASVMRIPLLIYDVGGVTEMIDPKLHSDIICGTPKVCTSTLRACLLQLRIHGPHARCVLLSCMSTLKSGFVTSAHTQGTIYKVIWH